MVNIIESLYKDILAAKTVRRDSNDRYFDIGSVIFSTAMPVQCMCSGKACSGGLSPGLPANESKQTLSRLLQKSCVFRYCKCFVLLLMVKTIGSRNKSRVTASSPPGVLKSHSGWSIALTTHLLNFFFYFKSGSFQFFRLD